MTNNLKNKMFQRIKKHIRFRLKPIKRWYSQTVVGPVRANYGGLSRRLEYPISKFSPSKSKEIFLARPSEIGDVLMCTPAMREFKKRNPKTKIHFFTNYPEIVRGLPYIDSVLPYDERPWDSIEFSYENSLPPKRHIAKIFGDQLNIEVSDVSPDCVFSESLIQTINRDYGQWPRPWLVVNRKAGPWTPNKDWSDDSWNALIPSLVQIGTVFEIGVGKSNFNLQNSNYVNLVGRTSKNEMISLIAASDIHVGPISGPVHIAAAARVPSVVIYGGYELVSCSGYEENINLDASMKCSPCWLTTPCPVNKECLGKISVQTVLDSVKQTLDSKAVRNNNPNFSVSRMEICAESAI